MENESKIVERVVKLETKSEQHDKEIDELKDTQKMMYEMNSNIKLLVEKIGNTNEEIAGMKNDISGIKTDMSGMKDNINDVKIQADKKDAKKWDKFKWMIFGAIVLAILAFVFTSIGLK